MNLFFRQIEEKKENSRNLSKPILIGRQNIPFSQSKLAIQNTGSGTKFKTLISREKLSNCFGWKTRENAVVLDFLAVDNFDFTRKIVKKKFGPKTNEKYLAFFDTPCWKIGSSPDNTVNATERSLFLPFCHRNRKLGSKSNYGGKRSRCSHSKWSGKSLRIFVKISRVKKM